MTMVNQGHVVVVGAGPGGVATAALITRHGRTCVLLNRSLDRLRPIVELGGVDVSGELDPGFVGLPLVTDQPEMALREAELILFALPAYAQRPAVESLLPHLRPGMVLVFLSGSAATLEIASVLRTAGLLSSGIVLGETATLPLSARMTGPAQVRVKLHARMRAAALPATNTGRLVEMLSPMFEIVQTANVLDPALNNPNFLIHPAPMLLNYAAVERANGELSLINEGMTDGVLRLLDAVDEEKQALQAALGIDVLPIDDFYRGAGSTPDVYRKKGENFGSGFRDRVWPRYITEDVPYGTVLYSEFGQLLGVPTPVCNGINHLFSVLEGEDYRAAGRTLDRMGIAHMSPADLLSYLDNGVVP